MSDENIARRGLMLVLSSPSGAGKTTLSRRLLQSDPDIVMSVSATTRAPRPNEIDGQDYFFVSPDRFNAMIAAGEFLEHATVFGHKYGTPRAPVMAALDAGKDVLFDIDWQGTQQLRQRAGDDLVSIFVLPPSHDELERRLPDFDEPVTINLNGCPNACARIQTADIGLKGQLMVDGEGRQVEGFQVHLGGSLGLQAGFGRKVRGLKVTAAELPDYIERVLRRYLAEREDGERFAAWASRASEEALS